MSARHGLLTDLQRDLIERVDDELTRLELPQSWLADRAGVSQKHLSQLMQGRAEGTLTMWQRLLDVLEATP